MDNKKPAEKNKASRSLKTLAIGAGVLTIAAAGGAYYFPEYLPLEQTPIPGAAPAVAAKPQTVPPKPAVKPAVSQPAAQSVALAPVAPATQQPAPAQMPNAAAAARTSAKQVKGGQLAQEQHPVRKVSATTKPASKQKRHSKTRQTTKPVQIAESDSNLGEKKASEEVSPPPQDVLLKPAFPQPEPVPAEPPRVITVEPAPAPIPAPVEATPAAPAETIPAAPVAPATAPSVVVPKYNDLATAVLRGDREAARELLDLGWWVDKPSASGVTPLMAAVMNRDATMVELLLNYGAEPTAQALSLARKNKDTATATLLEKRRAR